MALFVLALPGPSVILQELVTGTCCFFQFASVKNGYVSSRARNGSYFSQTAQGIGDAGSTGSKNQRESFLGQREAVEADAAHELIGGLAGSPHSQGARS
jgi:hypothetical protein